MLTEHTGGDAREARLDHGPHARLAPAAALDGRRYQAHVAWRRLRGADRLASGSEGSHAPWPAEAGLARGAGAGAAGDTSSISV